MDNGAGSYRRFLDGDAIGRHVAIDFVRHHSRQLNTPVEDMKNYLREERSLEESYLQKERDIAVHQALSKLPVDYRTILWLVFFENFSNKEASVILKKNERQIRNLLYRAKQSLKSKLEEVGFVYEE